MHGGKLQVDNLRRLVLGTASYEDLGSSLPFMMGCTYGRDGAGGMSVFSKGVLALSVHLHASRFVYMETYTH